MPRPCRFDRPPPVAAHSAKRRHALDRKERVTSMAKYTRGEFLGLAGMTAGALVTGSVAEATHQSGRPDEAELAVINGTVYTVDDAQPRAEAFAVRNGRFIAVGSTADIRNLVTSRTTVIDARGRRSRPASSTRTRTRAASTSCSASTATFEPCASCRTRSGRPRDRIARTVGDRVHVRRHEVRRACSIAVSSTTVVHDHPIAVHHRGGHTSWYNSKALRAGAHRRGHARSVQRPLLPRRRAAS